MTQQIVDTSFDGLLKNYESIAVDSGVARKVGDILIVPFWKPSFCKLVITAAESNGAFKPLPDDITNNAAPGRELRVTQFSNTLKQCYVSHWINYLSKLVEEFYEMTIFRGDRTLFRDPFILKYTMDGQRSMNKHHDFSLLSFSMKLNDGFTGSELHFTRQGWSNRDVPVGNAVIFPGLITHPHYAAELTSGVRYSMTGWLRAPNIERRDTI